MNKLYIIVPCYNESSVLRETVENLVKKGYSVICVDDCTEKNHPLPDELLQGLPVICLRHPYNMGQGAALQTGMDYAIRQGADAVIHFDADGQHHAEDIPAFLAALDDGADIALGSRFLRQEDIKKIPGRKRLVLRLARLFNWAFTGMQLTDAHNGFRALGPRALRSIHLNENRMSHATEILSQIHSHHLKCVEIPTSIDYTDYSKGKGQHISNSLNIVLDLLIDRFVG